MNDFDKTFVLAFYNSSRDKKMLILNTFSFQKMLSNLTCVLIYFLI